MPAPKRKIHKREFVTTLEGRLKEKDPLIQVILGPRQVGKTTGVESLSGFKNQIYYATADDALTHSENWIAEQWQNALSLRPNPILIIDEIQKILHWSDRIKALWDSASRKKAKLKLVLLGSSSLSLSEGIEESLAGRFEVIPAPHWGFEESRKALQYTLDEYLLFGGYPGAARFKKNFGRWQNYLKSSIIDAVINKDILRRRTVKNPALFRQCFELLSSYPAQEVSYNKLLGQLQEKGNIDLVKHYIELFEGAFLFKTLQKYSGSFLVQKSSSPKVLPLCPSLYSYKVGPNDLEDPEIRGRVFEACVGSELSRLPGSLFYWRDGNFEVDFIYTRGTQLIAIEVKSGRRKRGSGLTEFLKRYPKAEQVFISPENFEEFSKNPSDFLGRLVNY